MTAPIGEDNSHDLAALDTEDQQENQGAGHGLVRKPAARVMDSFMSEPPISLQPHFSSCAARSGPIFTQDACRLF